MAVLQELFAQCSLKVEDVESIQLVGSVTRMPSLCRAIKVAPPPYLPPTSYLWFRQLNLTTPTRTVKSVS